MEFEHLDFMILHQFAFHNQQLVFCKSRTALIYISEKHTTKARETFLNVS